MKMKKMKWFSSKKEYKEYEKELAKQYNNKNYTLEDKEKIKHLNHELKEPIEEEIKEHKVKPFGVDFNEEFF